MYMEAIVRQAMAGDEEAFLQLLMMHKDRLYRIALAYVKNEEDALEAIQETTFRAWKTIRKLRDPNSFSTWLVRILLNCCHDEWKRKRRQRERADRSGFLDEGKPSPPAEAEWVGRIHMADALDRLEPKYKQVILLKYYEDMTLTAIAETLGKPVGTVKTWLHKALAQMKPLISEEEEARHGTEFEGTH